MFIENSKGTKTSENQYLGIAFLTTLITYNDMTCVRYTIKEKSANDY